MSNNNAKFLLVSGFDRNGEPELHLTDDDVLHIQFSMMPPELKSGEARRPELFETFEITLSQFLGLPVLRDDKETFLVLNATPEIAKRLAQYLERFWSEHASNLIQPKMSLSNGEKIETEAQLKKLLENQLRPAMKQIGFAYFRKADMIFSRKVVDGFYMLWVTLHGYVPQAKAQAHLMVFHEVLECIYALASGLERSALKNQWQGYQRLKIAGEGDSGTPVLTPYETEAWSKSVLNALQKEGLLQLEKNINLQTLDQHLNPLALNPNPNLEVGAPDVKAAHGLIVARLLDRADVENVIAYHTQQLSKRPDDVPNIFPQVVKYVMSYTRSELLEEAAKF
jgi:hypothetical protein